MNKKTMFILGAIILLTTIIIIFTFNSNKVIEGNTLIFEKDSFKDGEFNCVEFDGEKLVLASGNNEGYYESKIIRTEEFRALVSSWNCRTNENASVEIQVKIKSKGKWSNYKTYGEWSTNGKNSGSVANQDDDVANMKIDIISTKIGEYANGIRYKVILKGMNPEVDLVAFALTKKDEDKNEATDYFKTIKSVETISQMDSGHPYSNVICSPTALTMVLKHYGVDINLFDVADGVYDNGAGIFGNWSYNVAFASECGLKAYVERGVTIDDIKIKISQGLPIVASIRTDSEKFLEGSPMAYPAGHLLVVVGFENNGGEEYIIVNDPAAEKDTEVRRKYKVKQFENAWSGYTYVISEKE